MAAEQTNSSTLPPTENATQASPGGATVTSNTTVSTPEVPPNTDNDGPHAANGDLSGVGAGFDNDQTPPYPQTLDGV